MSHDVFICHASEDKPTLVRPLAEVLRDQRIDVWYDEFSLRVGTSLRQSIDRGLAGSRYGIVIFSPAFFAKPWTNWELNGLVTRLMQEGKGLLIPIWHNVGVREVAAFSPSLADILALNSSDGVDTLSKRIIATLRPVDSPLIVAKAELERFGFDAPPISDDWWLGIVESQSEIQFPEWRRPLLFPLPKNDGSAADRGRSIAWTALQISWQDKADRLNICQTSRPDEVLAFIADDSALMEACHQHPDILCNYAPQLLIPEFSDYFRGRFEHLLVNFEARISKLSITRPQGTTCEKRFALRYLDFGNHSPCDVADKWVNGLSGFNSAKHWSLTDYLFWLLSAKSAWLPDRVRTVLVEGMKNWAAWSMELFRGDPTCPVLTPSSNLLSF